MPNSWGRPPRNEIWQDLQALALWVVIIAVAGYLLFPNFFKDVYAKVSEPAAVTDTLNEVTLPATSETDSLDSQLWNLPTFPSVSNSLYNGKSEISTGYWIIFVADGEFQQLAVNSESYAFLLRLIESDSKATVKNTVILAANGQIRKYIVSDEVYAVITNMNVIDARARGA